LAETAIPTGAGPGQWFEKYPSARYVAPFVTFLALLTLAPKVGLAAEWEAPIRVCLLATICAVCWPPEISVSPRRWLASIAIGLAAFALWIAPDALIPGYRSGLLFSNSIIGHLHSSMQAAELRSNWVLAWRTARAVIVVPVVEELFWRAWLMRWLINTDFRRVPLGAFTPFSFWVTAILFSSEHGPYWDVGLLTGIIYNWWMIRTKSVADCILMHAVTNLALSLYVIGTAQWQYWQ
jgi:CAAX prenyl protease-like protein